MTVAEKALEWMEGIARDDSHGYSQYNRWGNPDYDCSSLVISAYEHAGVPVKSLGGSVNTWTMPAGFLACGFKDVTNQVDIGTGAGLKPGDVLLREGHTAMYAGDHREVEASSDEVNGIKGAIGGDQTGYEISINPYNPNWTMVLRYEGPEEEGVFMFECRTIMKGDTGRDVKRMQALLRGRGFKDRQTKALPKVDGVFGEITERSLMWFQEKCKLQVDGICGPKTWAKLEYFN